MSKSSFFSPDMTLTQYLRVYPVESQVGFRYVDHFLATCSYYITTIAA